MPEYSLKEKLRELKSLSDVIQLHGNKLLTREQSVKVQELHDRMEFRLKELVNESKAKEADIKLDIFENIIKVLNKKDV